MACGVLWSLRSLTPPPGLGGTTTSPSARALLCAVGREEWLLWADRGPPPQAECLTGAWGHGSGAPGLPPPEPMLTPE